MRTANFQDVEEWRRKAAGVRNPAPAFAFGKPKLSRQHGIYRFVLLIVAVIITLTITLGGAHYTAVSSPSLHQAPAAATPARAVISPAKFTAAIKATEELAAEEEELEDVGDSDDQSDDQSDDDASNDDAGSSRMVALSDLSSSGSSTAFLSLGDDSDIRPKRKLRHMYFSPGQAVITHAHDHSLVLSGDGRIFAFGEQHLGRLGVSSVFNAVTEDGHAAQLREPTPVDSGQLPARRVLSVAAGLHHSIAATFSGEVHTWGSNSHGQLGLRADDPPKDAASFPAERVRYDMLEHKVILVAAGPSFSLAATDSGKLFTWGLNYYNGKTNPSVARHIGGALEGKKVVALAAGFTHWACITDDGRLYTALSGADAFGEPAEMDEEGSLLALGRTGNPRVPLPVGGDLANKVVVSVATGRSFTLAVTEDGTVWSWGVPSSDVLGRGVSEGEEGVPGRVWEGGIKDKLVVGVSAGEYFSLAWTADGELFAWGDNMAHGQTGLGKTGTGGGAPDTPTVAVPTRVTRGLEGYRVILASAGSQHALAVVKRKEGWEPADTVVVTPTTTDSYVEPSDYPQGGDGLHSSSSDGFHVTAADVSQAGGPTGLEGSAADVTIPEAGVEAVPVVVDASGSVGMTTQQPGGGTKVPRVAGARGQVQGVNADAGEVPRKVIPAAGTAGGASTKGVAAQSTALAVSGGAGTTWPRATAATNWNLTPLPLSFWGADELAKDAATKERVDKIVYDGMPPVDQLMGVDPELFHELPDQYDPGFKSPCWYAKPDSKYTTPGTLLCLPYFHILGVSKCGTTDLYHRLSLHPDVYESRNKGPHWWDEGNQGVTWYFDLYKYSTERIAKAPMVGIVGDASSNTLTYNGVAVRNKRVKHVNVAEVMRLATPDVKLIAIFRNPVDRIYSSYYYYNNYKANPNPNPTEFHAVATKQVDLMNRCMETKTAAACAHQNYFNAQQLIKGMFSVYLPAWWEVFPREQLLVLRMEHYSKNTKAELVRVMDFLGMREPSEAEWGKILEMKTKNTRETNNKGGTGASGPMLPETREMLERFYRPFNEQLAHMLGDQGFLWAPA
eukprot:jgi/Mesvir1/19126/Mv12867-RA.1